MFQETYIIQFSSVFVVFLMWFVASFVLRFVQMTSRAEPPAAAATTTSPGDTGKTMGNAISERQHFRSAIAAERTLLDGFLLLAIGVSWNVYGQGNKTAGDVFSLVSMSVLFIMAIVHYAGMSSKTPLLWSLLALSLLGLYITPFVTQSRPLETPEMAPTNTTVA